MNTTKNSKTGSKQQGLGDDQDPLPDLDLRKLGVDNLETILRNLKVEVPTLKVLRSVSTNMQNLVDSLFILNNYHGIAGVRLILIKTIIRFLNRHNELKNVIGRTQQMFMIRLAIFELCILNIHSDATGGTQIFLHYRNNNGTPPTHVYFEGGYGGTTEQNNQIIQAIDSIFNRIDGIMNDRTIMAEGDQFEVNDVHIYPLDDVVKGMVDTVVEIMTFIKSNLLTKPPPRKRRIDAVLLRDPNPTEIAAAVAVAVSVLDVSTRIPEFVYVTQIDLITLIQKHRSDQNDTPFSTYLTQLLKALNDPRFKQYNYTNIVTKNVGNGIADIVYEVEKLIPPSQVQPVHSWLDQPQPEGGNRGSKPKSYKKTSDKFKYKKRDYVVYKGTHSGLYIKLDGGYKSVKSITRK